MDELQTALPSTAQMRSITADRIHDLAQCLKNEGFAVIAQAITSHPANVRHFSRHQDEMRLINHDMKLIVELERIIATVSPCTILPRRRPGTADVLDQLRERFEIAGGR